jgi:hypothetical protein
MNGSQFKCGNSTFSIDQCINGQTPLTYYDALAQVGLQRSLREGTVLCYWDTGVEGLFSQMAAVLGQDKRVVKANPFYWTESCSDFAITVCVKKSEDAVPDPGDSVTVSLDDSSMSANGKNSIPTGGYRAYIKELKGKGVNILSVDKTVMGGHTIQLEPLNGEVLDLTALDKYTLLVDTLRMYKKGDTECIVTEGFVQNPPALRKGYVQKFEKGYCIHEDEIDGYAYNVEFRVNKGIDPLTKKKVDYWHVPQVTNKLLTDWIDSRNINTMFGVRDDVKQEGFDGMVTTAEAQGMFSRNYDPASGVSLKAHLMGMIKSIRKTNGCTDMMFLHDFNWGMDWSEGIAQMVKDYGQNLNFSLFGNGGKGTQNFEFFQFKDFKAFNYQFRTFQIDMFDNMRYGNFLSDFAIVMPACKFKDTNGKVVPPVTYTNIAAAEEAAQKKIWSYNEMERGCRVVNVFAKDSYGLEIHCASKLGVMRKVKC